jgi:hypothetical protein
MSADEHLERTDSRVEASDCWDVVVVPTELSTPVELVGRDPFRLRVQIVNTGGNVVVINSSRDGLTSSTPGFVLPPGGSIALDTRAAIWAMSLTTPAGGGPSEISVLLESSLASP